MRYLGGKHRQGPAIAAAVMKLLQDGGQYAEPFCGAMGSATRVAQAVNAREWKVQFTLSDVQEPLMCMWRAVLEGWEPPEVVTEEEYRKLKATQDPHDPMTAFAGYACSFAAKYFGTYARCDRNDHSRVQPYARQSKKAILDKALALWALRPPVRLACGSYERCECLSGAVIYLDPPYVGRTPQNARNPAFDHAKFWDFARRLSKRNAVLVSEFIWPSDFVVVHNWGDTVVRHYAGQGSDGTQEALVCLRGSAAAVAVPAPGTGE